MHWAGPALASCYDAKRLCNADLLRASAGRSPRAEAEWRTSRALLQRIVPAGVLTLTHKNGHAVVATAPDGWRVGIDLEAARWRDVDRLAPWMACPDESAALSAMAPQTAQQHFYRLWTLKEAMVKARGLPFPAGLRRSALIDNARSGTWRLHTEGETGWAARVFESASGWTLALVWRAPQDETADITLRIVSDAPAGAFSPVLQIDDSVEWMP